MTRICVFAGSRDGRPEHRDAARALGAAVARRGWGVVYGGAGLGCMRAVADAALAAGGEVIGVIPRSMVDRELAHRGLTELVVVGSMHERKATMHALSDAFVALPGGFGTLDELFEAITWRQIGLHAKAIALLDVGGYWEPLLGWIERAVAGGFVAEGFARSLTVARDPEVLLDALGLASRVNPAAAPRGSPGRAG